MTTTSPVSGYDPLASVGTQVHDDRPPKIRMAAPVMGDEEVDAVREVLESGFLTNGPFTRRFETMMATRHGTEHAVALANGTVALAAMYLALDIGPGDEVIVPSLTFVATASSVLHVGATPVFADIVPSTLNLDPDDVARRITSRTRAIVPIHYGGQAAEMAAFRSLADAHGIALLEDAAQAVGASFQGRPVGSWGDAAMFSFTPTKNVTTGEGSVVTTNDGDLAHRMRLLRNHGMSGRYHYEMVGWNWRLSDIQAAIGCCQLDRLDSILATKRANADIMGGLLADIDGVTAPTARPDRDHPYLLYTLEVPANRRDRLIDALAAAGIESRIYFPSLHRQPVFSDHADADLPVTDEKSERILSIPFHSRLGEADMQEIAEVIRTSVA